VAYKLKVQLSIFSRLSSHTSTKNNDLAAVSSSLNWQPWHRGKQSGSQKQKESKKLATETTTITTTAITMAIFKRTSKNTSSKRKSEPKKRVTFVEEDAVDQVEMFENKDDIWYSRTDEGDFEERDTKMGELLQEMDPAELEIKLGESPRGLEHTKEECGKAITHRRTCSVAAVVATQKLFLKLGKDGRDSIARACGAVSEKAIEIALERAEMDTKFVIDHVRVSELENRTFEKRDSRPSVMGRQTARRSLAMQSA
jgi:hypothetical protein